MLRSRNSVFLLMAILALGLSSCEETFSPKPKGYYRIATPSTEYQETDIPCLFSFEYNRQAKIVDKQNCWYDIKYPNLRATLQLTYKEVTASNLDTLLAEGHHLAYKHTVKADGIEEKLYLGPDQKVYGILYQLKGNSASSLQFFVTDSTDHFLRGVLYYYASPNADSLKPVNDFMFGEIQHLMETLKWQN
jgi:gliding motility-associated lipoprotein GldD